jgi:hypothetical protein
MKGNDKAIKSVAIIGAGAAGKRALCGVIFLLTKVILDRIGYGNCVCSRTVF